MKYLQTILVGLFITFQTFGQTSNQKIKVILFGTFHYGQTGDRGKTAFPDLFSKKRQIELDSIAFKLKKVGVNKIFLETPASNQQKQDSLYLLYKSHKLTDTTVLRDEEIQIGFRTAILNNAKLIASDIRQDLPYDKIQAYETAHKNDTINPYPFFEVKYPSTQKEKRLTETSLENYYIQLNGLYSRQSHMYDYIHYALGYGEDKDYTGEAFTLSWYDRNLKIFTNILRNIDYKSDKVILVLYGSSHTALLRHFFEDHPYFEIIEINKILK